MRTSREWGGVHGFLDFFVVNGNVLVVKGLTQASVFSNSILLSGLTSYFSVALEC